MTSTTRQLISTLVFGITGVLLSTHQPVLGQSLGDHNTPRQTLNWPLTVSIQFHNVGMPLRDLGSAFSNIGFSVGTEFAYNQNGNLLQGVQVGYSRNKAVGDAIFLYTQGIYRPAIGPVFTELKAGVGIMEGFRPTEVFVQTDGNWQPVRHSGKPMLMVPLGVSVGYFGSHRYPAVVPSITYQLVPIRGYNPGVPVVPHQFIQLNSRIQF